jgi:hypothetical protein
VALKPTLDFSWGFLEEISWWSLGIASVVSVAATVITRQTDFALACMLAASIDFAFIRAIAGTARREIDEGELGAAKSSMLFVVRLMVKAVLLGLAVLFPEVFSFVGMVVGVLAFDLSLAVVGSLLAGTRLMRSSRMGR